MYSNCITIKMGKRNPHTNPGGRKRGVYVEERWRRLPSSHLQKCPNVFPRCLESVTRWAAGTSVALKQHSCVWVSSYLAFLPCPPLALPQAYSPSVMDPPLQVVSPILSAWLPQVLVPRVLGGYGFRGSEHLQCSVGWGREMWNLLPLFSSILNNCVIFRQVACFCGL